MPVQLIEYAHLSEHVYKIPSEPIRFDWVIVEQREEAKGFLARLYKNENHPGELIFSVRGTKVLPNVITDLKLVSGQSPNIYRDAFVFLEDVIASNPGKNVSIVGHSLGALIAEMLALKFRKNAVVFESPGCAPWVEGVEGFDQNFPEYITSYLVDRVIDQQTGSVKEVINLINTAFKHVGDVRGLAINRSFSQYKLLCERHNSGWGLELDPSDNCFGETSALASRGISVFSTSPYVTVEAALTHKMGPIVQSIDSGSHSPRPIGEWPVSLKLSSFNKSKEKSVMPYESALIQETTLEDGEYLVYLMCRKGGEHGFLILEGKDENGLNFLVRIDFLPKVESVAEDQMQEAQKEIEKVGYSLKIGGSLISTAIAASFATSGLPAAAIPVGGSVGLSAGSVASKSTAPKLVSVFSNRLKPGLVLLQMYDIDRFSNAVDDNKFHLKYWKIDSRQFVDLMVKAAEDQLNPPNYIFSGGEAIGRKHSDSFNCVTWCENLLDHINVDHGCKSFLKYVTVAKPSKEITKDKESSCILM